MIIAFSGQKQSGKSTATKMVMEILGESNCKELKFADPLKDMLRSLYRYSHYTVDEVEDRLEGNLKELEDSFLGTTPRHAMQTLGTEWRDLNNTNIWSTIWYRRAKKLNENHTHVITSDLRFPHEIDMLRSLGGKLIHITRHETVTPEHASEQDLSGRADYFIDNSGELTLMREAIVNLINQWG